MPAPASRRRSRRASWCGPRTSAWRSGRHSAPTTLRGRRSGRIAFDNIHELTMDESGEIELDPPAAHRLHEIDTPTLVLKAEHVRRIAAASRIDRGQHPGRARPADRGRRPCGEPPPARGVRRRRAAVPCRGASAGGARASGGGRAARIHRRRGRRLRAHAHARQAPPERLRTGRPPPTISCGDALAVIAAGLAAARWGSGAAAAAGWFLVAGTLVFSGSLYALGRDRPAEARRDHPDRRRLS